MLLTFNSTYVTTVTATVTQLTTVFGRRRSIPELENAEGFSPIETRQTLGDLPIPLIQMLCDCLNVAHPVAPTKTAIVTKVILSTKTRTVTSRTTTVLTATTTTTVQSTTTIPRVTITGAPTTTAAPGPVSWDGLCGDEGDGETCLGSSFGNCCARFGACGSDDSHCGSGCQPLYGTCN